MMGADLLVVAVQTFEMQLPWQPSCDQQLPQTCNCAIVVTRLELSTELC